MESVSIAIDMVGLTSHFSSHSHVYQIKVIYALKFGEGHRLKLFEKL